MNDTIIEIPVSGLLALGGTGMTRKWALNDRKKRHDIIIECQCPLLG
ncbi:hypothetical protein HET73_00135 [Wolbachia endosymbiont of Atemnus politus]|nr:hypothetical protein [Wolbachia endosymbiont of Atemnus politus]NSM56139.1 hypothetical protein [Wolbachia endosymbiont of Atemnus politus]